MSKRRSATTKRLDNSPGGTRAEEEPGFLICDHEQYPQVEPGDYELYCTEAKAYFDPGLKSWKCRYRFIKPMASDFPAIYGFINLGKEPKSPGSRSRYFREWTIANGESPRKSQRMSPRTFTSKFFLVRVDWVQAKQHDGKEHTEATRYSLVREIKARIGP